MHRYLTSARNRFQRFALGALTAPVALADPASALRFHVHSSIERRRVRHVGEPWTFEWLRALPAGAVLFDIGANIGITALVAAERPARDVRVVAVEPFPGNFSSLAKNIVLNGYQDVVIPLPVGVAGETGVRTFNWAGADAGSALHSFGEIVRPRTGQRLDRMASHQCLTYRLDDLAMIDGIGVPTHLKIDVDGGERDVLAGARETLADPRCVGAQIEVYDNVEGATADVTGIMERAGFVLEARWPHAFEGVVDLQFAKR